MKHSHLHLDMESLVILRFLQNCYPKKNVKKICIVLGLILFFLPVIYAQNSLEFGEFTVLHIDPQFVQDVIVEGTDIYAKFAPEHHHVEVTVRISDSPKTNYRFWVDGEKDWVTKIYQSNLRGKKGYTYRINTTAPFVELWVGDQFVLHLARNVGE